MLIFKLLNFLAGYREIVCHTCFARETVNILIKNEIDYWDLSRSEDGQLHFFILEKEWKRFCKEISDYETEYFSTKRIYGLPQFVRRYRKRIGLPVGAAVILILVQISTQYVWDITVSGNDKLSDEEITEALETLGFGIGSHIPDVDYYSLCHEFILKNEDICWISVNMVGTTAEVKVIERSAKGDIQSDNGTPSNLLAARDGLIVRTETESGATAVTGGQEVKKGDLLVSGIVQTDRDDEAKFVLVRSKAKVYAQTERVFRVQTPLKGTKKVCDGKETVSKSLKFFGKWLNIKKNSSISEKECDIIEENKRVVLFEDSGFLGGIPLPVWVKSDYTEVYHDEEYSLTEEEAMTEALIEMSKLFSDELSDAEILERGEDSEITEIDGIPVLVLTWTVSCIENIAEEAPIGVK